MVRPSRLRPASSDYCGILRNARGWRWQVAASSRLSAPGHAVQSDWRRSVWPQSPNFDSTIVLPQQFDCGPDQNNHFLKGDKQKRYRILVSQVVLALSARILQLLARGDQVLVLDDLSTGSKENIRHLTNNPNFNYWIDSMMNKALLAELVDESDVVVHLAAAVGVRLIVESPVRTIETNVRGTELVLNAALPQEEKAGVHHFNIRSIR